MTARLIMRLAVERAWLTAPDVLAVVFRHPRKPELPPWTAGAHVDLRLSDGRIRQYSLCGDPADRTLYRIAIKRELHGRGGSKLAHEFLKPGEIALVSAPRNNFPLAANASRHVMVAGGIGVTPMLAMAHQLEAAGQDFVLHYCARNSQAPLLAELQEICGKRLVTWFGDENRRFDPTAIGPADPGTHLYTCGPQRLVEAIKRATTRGGWPETAVHVEVFQPTLDENFKAEPFDVTLASTGETLRVPADLSLLDVLRDHGIPQPSSCELGVCGACECGYSDGVVIHRDQVLPITARQDRMMPCVSRARVSVTIDL